MTDNSTTMLQNKKQANTGSFSPYKIYCFKVFPLISLQYSIVRLVFTKAHSFGSVNSFLCVSHPSIF